jgi:RNA-directed DNA polymerase
VSSLHAGARDTTHGANDRICHQGRTPNCGGRRDSLITAETSLIARFNSLQGRKKFPASGRKRPETIYFLGFTLYCTRNLKGNFRIGMRTEKSRLRRSLMSLQDLLRRIRHLSVREQVNILNAALRGHYAYYGIAGNFRSLQKVHRAVERYWHKMLCSRSWAGRITWDTFHQIKQRQPILRPKLYLPYRELQALAGL